MCEILRKLHIITPLLPKVPLSEYKIGSGVKVLYEFQKGTALSESLYSTPDIAIAKTLIPKGTIFDTHAHFTSNEWIIIMDGILEINVNGQISVLDKFKSIKIDMNENHSARAIEATTIIAITIPRDDGFPE